MQPAMQVEEALMTSMLAASLKINSSVTVDGGDALVKSGEDWDIWGSDESAEDE